jgi:threonine/homoserine efflux transporter RhtA
LIGHGLVIVLALCAAVFMAIGIVVRQRATMDVPAEDGVSAAMFTTLPCSATPSRRSRWSRAH